MLFKINTHLRRNFGFRCLINRYSLVFVLCCSQVAWSEVPASRINADNQPQEVENVRLWHSPERTRVVFEVSENVTYSMFRLDTPRRLVLDIENANLSINLPSLDETNQHVSAIRFGTPKENVLRFVFELKKPLRAIDFVLSPNELYGHRLVIDIDELNAADSLNDFSQLGSSTGQPYAGDVGATTNSVTSSASSAIQSKVAAAPLEEASTVVPQAQQEAGPIIIAIDAGHGGEDPGALGYRGTREKNITLAIANRLQKIVDLDPRMKSFMVRTGDYYIELHKRREMARARKADIFISIHADAFTKKGANGLSVFALSQSGATSAMASALATKENGSDLIGGVSLAGKNAVLAQVLVDLSMNNTISESVNFGGRVLKKLDGLGKLRSRRVEQAGFAVLKSADIPSILIETGFITNPEEERKLKSAGYQQKLANAIYAAIDDYFSQTPFRSNASFASTSYTGPDYKSLVTPKSNPRSNPESKRTNNRVQSHKVVRGDSLSKIGQRYGVSIAKLKKLNGLRGSTVVLGQRLKLPSSGGSSALRNGSSPAVHVVKQGDSLSKISSRYNVTISALKSANNLRKDTVYLGQKLRIPGGQAGSEANPPANPSTHKVKRGDTLSEIASMYGMTMSKIVRANQLSSRSVLLGQVLKIPN
ncbi:MAG: N-acetylmuramoyl-L-alanine amidase [Dinoroseobacter sp.]